jgi:hypothetical protein
MSGSNPSGNLQNPGCRYFLKLAPYALRAVNLVRDNDRITYGRKATICCCMALDLCGKWRVEQLSSCRILSRSTRSTLLASLRRHGVRTR